MLLVDEATEDDDAVPAEALGVQPFGAPEVEVRLSSCVAPPTVSASIRPLAPEPAPIQSAPLVLAPAASPHMPTTRRVLEDPLDLDHDDAFDRFHAFHDPDRLDELSRLDALDEAEPVHELHDLDRPIARRSGSSRGWSIRFVCSLLCRVLAVAVVVLIALTIAPFGRPDRASIVAGGSAQQVDLTAAPVAGRALSSTTTSTVVAFADLRGAAAPIQIDIAQIAESVDPSALGFDPDPEGWVEPTIEPESQWIDGGNGIALPDLLLRIRFCESSNNYRAAHVTSSARGAYQFLAKSWDWYGHAERYGVAEAHLATPAQQDEAALRTYREAGARPWAESRHCWDSPDIDPRYLTARPPAPVPTTTAPPSASTETSSESTTAPTGGESTTTAAESTTSDPATSTGS